MISNRIQKIGVGIGKVMVIVINSEKLKVTKSR